MPADSKRSRKYRTDGDDATGKWKRRNDPKPKSDIRDVISADEIAHVRHALTREDAVRLAESHEALREKLATAEKRADDLNGGPPDPMWRHMVGTAKSHPCMKGDKDSPLSGGCCCTCVHHHEDHSHPVTNGRSCTEVRGWICASPEDGWASGWGEHGGCACHMTAEEWEARR